jgi:hypothetical protein
MDTLMVNSMVDSVAQGIEETSESLTFPLGCVGVRSCTFLGEPSLYPTDRRTYPWHPSFVVVLATVKNTSLPR